MSTKKTTPRKGSKSTKTTALAIRVPTSPVVPAVRNLQVVRVAGERLPDPPKTRGGNFRGHATAAIGESNVTDYFKVCLIETLPKAVSYDQARGVVGILAGSTDDYFRLRQVEALFEK